MCPGLSIVNDLSTARRVALMLKKTLQQLQEENWRKRPASTLLPLLQRSGLSASSSMFHRCRAFPRWFLCLTMRVQASGWLSQTVHSCAMRVELLASHCGTSYRRCRHKYAFTKQIDGWLHYTFPEWAQVDLPKSVRRYKGQAQKWCASSRPLNLAFCLRAFHQLG